jgi:hypothetical protein
MRQWACDMVLGTIRCEATDALRVSVTFSWERFSLAFFV